MNPIRNDKSLRNAIASAISTLKKDKINGTIYFYKSKECSCCYGPEGDFDFTIHGNYAKNQGWYGSPYEGGGYGISYERDQEKAIKIALMLENALDGTGWCLSWSGDIGRQMFIKKLYVNQA